MSNRQQFVQQYSENDMVLKVSGAGYPERTLYTRGVIFFLFQPRGEIDLR